MHALDLVEGVLAESGSEDVQTCLDTLFSFSMTGTFSRTNVSGRNSAMTLTQDSKVNRRLEMGFSVKRLLFIKAKQIRRRTS